MGGPGSTGSAEDVVNAAVNATLKNSSRPDPQTCPPHPPSTPSQVPRIPVTSYTRPHPTPPPTTPPPSPTCDGQAWQHSLELKGKQAMDEGRQVSKSV